MKTSGEDGMQTFDQALFELYESGQINYENALRNADSVNDLRLNIKLNSQRKTPTELQQADQQTQSLSIQQDENPAT